MPESAWAQWGSRPNQGTIKDLQGTVSSMIRNATNPSPSISAVNSSDSSTPVSAIRSIQSFWTSVQNLATDAVQSENVDKDGEDDALVTMENGRLEPDVRDSKRRSFWPQTNRNVNGMRSDWLPTLSWFAVLHRTFFSILKHVLQECAIKMVRSVASHECVFFQYGATIHPFGMNPFVFLQHRLYNM